MLQTMPKDRVQRTAYVRDRRKKENKTERARQARIKSDELNTITDNIDKAWGSRAHHSFAAVFAGFGKKKMARGTRGVHVFRNGKWVKA